MTTCDGKPGSVCLEDLNSNKSPYSPLVSSRFNATQPSHNPGNGLSSHRASIDSQVQDVVFDPDSETPYDSGASDQQRASYDSAQSQNGEYSGRQLPHVTSFNPTQGTNGCPILITLSTDYDLLAHPAPSLSLSFANKQVFISHNELIRVPTSGADFQWAISIGAPPFHETESTRYQVAVRLHLQEEAGQSLGSVDLGRFEYMTSHHYQSPQNSLKRKMSDEPDHTTPGRPSYPYAGNSYQNIHSIDLDNANRRFTPFGRAQHQQRYRDTYSVPAALPSQSLMRSLGSQASAWNPNLVSYSGRSPGYPGETQTVSLSTSENTPMLVRTTALSQNGSPGGNPAGPSGFNPYLYPQKALLKIHGDLGTMTENWTSDEWAAKRRLVVFTRNQQKSTINATFAPVAPEDRRPDSICVSCIWWEERQECFATSVDTISLLESLVAMRFTVEEKNRIRRNLEGFHPETVSKGKADSEEFFKIIMAFPNPKPRNIEKDVKVFPWKILSHALKKIISKYSASYSSTAGALGTPRTSSSFYDPPSFGRSASDGAAQAIYPPNMRAGTMSPHGMPPHLTDTPLSTASLPSIASDYSLSTVPSPYTDHSTYFPSPHMYSHHRTSSASAYDAPRPYKRPRASTTNAVSYTSHDAANLLSDLGNMSRSMSDHGSSHRLPSLSETYGQATPGMNQTQMGSHRGSYDFNSYLDSGHDGHHSGLQATNG